MRSRLLQRWLRPAVVATTALAVVLGAAALSGSTVTGSAVADPSSVRPMLPSVVTAPNENQFVPIAPCRIIDTRIGTGVNGTPLQPTQHRTYYVGGTTGFAPQGGNAGGCGIPVGASAIAATVVAVDPSAGGHLRGYANGAAEPISSFLNFSKGLIASTGVTLPINGSSAYALKLSAYGGATNVVVDVSGYYAKPMIALINADGTTYDGTNRATSSGRLSTGSYWIEFDRNIVYCAVSVTAYNLSVFGRADTFADASDRRVRVSLYSSVGALTDGWFYVVVHC
jgi:hypothetical protein